MTDQTVARIILEQIGGSAFLTMTGAKNLNCDDRSLTFHLPRFSGVKVTAVRVKLTPADEYEVTFFHGRGVKMREAKVVGAVYAEDLANLFREETGLETRVPTFARRAANA